jgi:hypothetical protein
VLAEKPSILIFTGQHYIFMLGDFEGNDDKSMASCPFSKKMEIQPESRCGIMSV